MPALLIRLEADLSAVAPRGTSALSKRTRKPSLRGIIVDGRDMLD